MCSGTRVASCKLQKIITATLSFLLQLNITIINTDTIQYGAPFLASLIWNFYKRFSKTFAKFYSCSYIEFIVKINSSKIYFESNYILLCGVVVTLYLALCLRQFIKLCIIKYIVNSQDYGIKYSTTLIQ